MRIVCDGYVRNVKKIFLLCINICRIHVVQEHLHTMITAAAQNTAPAPVTSAPRNVEQIRNTKKIQRNQARLSLEPLAIALSPYGWLMTHYGWLAG